MKTRKKGTLTITKLIAHVNGLDNLSFLHLNCHSKGNLFPSKLCYQFCLLFDFYSCCMIMYKSCELENLLSLFELMYHKPNHIVCPCNLCIFIIFDQTFIICSCHIICGRRECLNKNKNKENP